MRSLAFVLTVAFVFASASLLLPTSAAQSSGSLSGMVCAQAADSYPRPMPAGGDPSYAECSYYGQGLPGASVRLNRAGPVSSVPVGGFDQTVTTDEGGGFSFSSLQAGDYTLTVNRTGFETATLPLAIKDGAQHQEVALKGKTVTAAGKISDLSGNAIANADLQFCCSPNEVRALSGADGRYSASVTAGFWSIYVQAPGFQARSDYYLIDGSTEYPFTMEPVPPTDATIHGVVTDQDGNPIDKARVAASMYGGGCYYASDDPASGSPEGSASSMPCYDRPYYGGENFTFTDSAGKYVLGVYSGDGSLYVQKEGYAQYSVNLHIAAGEDQQKDLTVKKIPEKTAHIEGKVTDGKSAVRYAYLSINSPEFGIYECSMEADSAGGGSSGSSGSVEPSDASKPASSSIAYPGYYDPGCAITMNADGTFDGMVTPGYSIVSVWVDSYRACAETGDADGSYSRTCGPEYFQWTRTMTLAADDTTRIDITLRARPSPDATVSGYLIDQETGKAIPGAQVSFSNAETYGYGYATTDQDGSYKIRLRSGYHTVYAYAEGYLHWEGAMDIGKGDNDVDLKLTPGQEGYGGCCYPYAHDVAYAESDSGAKTVAAGGPPSSPNPASGMSGNEAMSSDGDSGTGEQYEDLGGGLGPYDAESREKELASGGDGNGVPAPGLGLLIVGLAGAVLVLRRRRA